MTRYRVGDERGSILLCALMLLFVLTIMGVALFDTALIDAQLAQHSVDDIRALESAQAGLQRALYRLFLDLCGTPTCANPSVTPSWADGMIDGQAVAVSTGAFAASIGSVTSFSGPFQDPRGAGFPEELHAGAYSVQIKHVTKGEAALLGVACLDGAAPDSTVCPHVVYLRSTGTFGRPGDEPTSVRVVQVLVRASSEAFAVGSMAMFGETVIGSPEVHGSLGLVPCVPPACDPSNPTTVTFSGVGSGIRNNHNGFGLVPPLEPGQVQTITQPLPIVRCSTTPPCNGEEVETLEAFVRIGKAQGDSSPALDLQGGVTVGEPGITEPGKPTMDRVYLGQGCAPQISPPCGDVVLPDRSRVHADRPIRADERGPPRTFPQLTDPTVILGSTYASYAACSPASCGAPGSDFFISHAFRIDGTTREDRRSYSDCVSELGPRDPGTGAMDCQDRLLLDLFQAGLNSSTPTFRHLLTCGPFCAAGGTRVNGVIFDSPPVTPPAFMLEWRGSDWQVYVDEALPGALDSTSNVLVIHQCADLTCNTRTPFSPGVVSGTSVTDPVAPVLIYFDGAISLCPVGSCLTGLGYHGHASFLAKGDITIDGHLMARCDDVPPASLCSGPSTRLTFPTKNLFAFYTPRNISVGTSGARTVMGRFYAGTRFRTLFPSSIVGGVSARIFELAGVPKFWEVKMPATVTALPGYGPQEQPARPSSRWEVREIRWKECSQRPVPAQPC